MTLDRDPLQTIIAVFLDAEQRGELIDREALIDQHQEHADSLRAFFAEHDHMKRAADLEQPTLQPQPVREDPTLPPQVAEPGEEPTFVPATIAVEPTIGDNVRYFGDYELLEEIARGGMGVVFKARQVNLSRIVALKLMALPFTCRVEVKFIMLTMVHH